MPLIQDGNIVELRVNYLQNGQRLMNVFHYVANEVSSDLEMEGALDYALNEFCESLTLWPQVWDNNATEECSIYKVQAQIIFPTRFYHMDKLVDIPGVIPVATAAPMPQNVQLSLTKVTAETGRGRTGRVEVPGATEDIIEAGRLNVDGLDWMDSLATALQQDIPLEALNPSKLVPVVLNAFAPAGSPPIELVRVQDIVRVDRRRTVGVGE